MNDKIYAYIAIVLTVLGAVSCGRSCTVLGIYALIAAVLFSLGALTFTNIQKKKNNFIQLKYITAAAYAVLAVTAVFFGGGIIWASFK